MFLSGLKTNKDEAKKQEEAEPGAMEKDKVAEKDIDESSTPTSWLLLCFFFFLQWVPPCIFGVSEETMVASLFWGSYFNKQWLPHCFGAIILNNSLPPFFYVRTCLLYTKTLLLNLLSLWFYLCWLLFRRTIISWVWSRHSPSFCCLYWRGLYPFDLDQTLILSFIIMKSLSLWFKLVVVITHFGLLPRHLSWRNFILVI